MRFIALFACLIAFCLTQPAAAQKAPEFRLGDGATPQKYQVRLAIDPTEKYFAGEIKIDFAFNRSVPVLWLNATKLYIDDVEIKQGERTIAAKVVPGNDDIVGLAATGEPFATGNATATIKYRGELEALSTRGLFKQQEGGEWYVVSQFEALSARRAFPCFDEPHWKTPWQLTITSPKTNFVASNTPEVAAYDEPDRAGWRLHGFAPTKPLPSYLIALAVGPFDVVDGGTAGQKKIPLRYLVPKGRSNELAWVKESTPRVLALMEEYFGSPYPFEKLDSVTIPQTINFGAMENVGLITYNASLMLAKPNEETVAFKRRYASIAGHEIAHMWFGNLVTPAWWDDIWLNEAFATWMAQKILYTYKPEWDDGWYRAYSRSQAINVDKLNSARKVKNPVNAKGEVDGAFDRITYQKGGQVLSMFEAWLTPEQFRTGVRNYMQRHAWGTATSQDFFRSLGEAAGRKDDALRAFTAFIEQPGVPLVSVSLQCAGKNASIKVSQKRLRPAGSRAAEMEWTTPACFRYGANGKVETQCAEIGSLPRNVPLSNAKSCPDWLLGNANGMGYYVTRYDAPLEKKLAKSAPRLPDHEATALTSDAALLAESGLMPIDAALEWSAASIRHASPVVQRAAVELLKAQRNNWLDGKQLRRKQQIVTQDLLPLARKVGWESKPGESDRITALRTVLLPYATEMEKDAALRLQARELALKWLAAKDSVPASDAEAILDAAGMFADSITLDKLESAALSTQDRRDQRWLFSALAKVRDPHLRKRSFALAVTKTAGADKVNGRDTLLFVTDALQDDHNQRAAFEFVRTNFDALVAKLPPETPAQTMTPLGKLCTRDDRAQFVNFYKDRAAKFLGGQRKYDQALERIDLCVAARDAQHPVATVRTAAR
jgi:cytosol alanyl aminopeptidase